METWRSSHAEEINAPFDFKIGKGRSESRLRESSVSGVSRLANEKINKAPFEIISNWTDGSSKDFFFSIYSFIKNLKKKPKRVKMAMTRP